MKRFFVDLYEMVWKSEWEFIKQHWCGYCIMVAVITLISTVYTNFEWFKEKTAMICDKIKRK